MFGTVFSSNGIVGAALAGASTAVSSAIAYTVGMEDAHIRVVENGGMFFLEGTAPDVNAIERATEVAVSIVGGRVCNRIEPC